MTPGAFVLTGSGIFMAAHFFSYAAVNIGLAAGLLAAAVCPRSRARIGGPWPGRVKAAAAALAGWFAISIALSPDSWAPGADLTFRTSFKPLLAFVLGVAASGVRADALAWMLPRVGLAATAFVVPLLPTIRGRTQFDLMNSVFGKQLLGPNVWGGICASLFFLVAARWWLRPATRFPGQGALLAVLLLGIWGSGSRSTLVMLLAGGLTAVLWAFSLRNLAKLAGASALFAGLLLAANPRLRPGGTIPVSFDMKVRGSIWSGALRAIRHRPVLGAGARRYRSQLAAVVSRWFRFEADGTHVYVDEPAEAPPGMFAPPGLYPHPHEAHNDYLTMAAQHGLPGLGFYLAFFFSIAAVARRAGRSEDPRVPWALARGVLAMIVGIGAYTAFNACWFNKEWGPFTGWLLGAFVGGTAAGRRGTGSPADRGRVV